MRHLAAAAALSLLALALAGCGQTPAPTVAPTVAPVTQTPWIVIVTATPGPTAEAAEAPTQTPWIIVVTATPEAASTRALPTATQRQASTPTTAPATPTHPPSATPTARAGTVIAVATRPAVTPSPTPSATHAAYRFKPPVLLEPPSGVTITWKTGVYMEWQPAGSLGEDEYYAVHLEAYRESDGSFWYGDSVLTTDSFYSAEGTFLAPFHPPASQGRAIVYWWVTVVKRTGEDPLGKPLTVDISPTGDRRFFITEPKPD